MKTMLIILICFAGGISMAKPFDIHTLGSGFAAPLVNGSSNITVTEPGAIILDNSGGTPVFKGNIATTYGAPTWQTLGSSSGAFTPPSVIVLSGSGTYAPTGLAPLYIRVTMVGGGGGGGGSGSTSGPNGMPGDTTTFNSIVAAGGSGGSGATATNGGAGGAGGTGGSGTATLRLSGAPGMSGPSALTGTNAGGLGGASGGGFGGGGNQPASGSPGNAGLNYGGGGSGCGIAGTSGTTGGGGGGEYVQVIIPGPITSYSYSVGAGGSGGVGTTTGLTGGTGGNGYIQVEEFYQ